MTLRSIVDTPALGQEQKCALWQMAIEKLAEALRRRDAGTVASRNPQVAIVLRGSKALVLRGLGPLFSEAAVPTCSASHSESTCGVAFAETSCNNISTGRLINFFFLQREDTTRELQFMFLRHPKPKPWRTKISCKRCLPDNMRRDNQQNPTHNSHIATGSNTTATTKQQEFVRREPERPLQGIRRPKQSTGNQKDSSAPQAALQTTQLPLHATGGATAPTQRAPNHTTVRMSSNQFCNNGPSANYMHGNDQRQPKPTTPSSGCSTATRRTPTLRGC